jgi:sugar lactone lactonase YvrE
VPSVEDPVLTSLDPIRILEGGRLWLRGRALPVPEVETEPCTIGGAPARVVFAASNRIALEVPAGLDGGPTEVKAPWLAGATMFVEVGMQLATGLHQVDSPVIDAAGRVYVTYSGSRGQQASVSIFRVDPGGPREPFVTGIVNATSLAFGPDDRLYVSSRFDGSVHRVFEDGRHEVFASDLGLACGIAFAPDGSMFVGDRSGTIFHVTGQARATTLATLPASVAAFHLAMGPDDQLYVTGPTLGSYDHLYRIDLTGRVETLAETFGRPQGLAFDSHGILHVAEALAGVSGIYRLPANGPREQVISGTRLVGIAFGRDGTVVVAGSETVWYFPPL